VAFELGWLHSYIPTFHSESRMIEACEVIKRNEFVLETPNSKENNSHRSKTAKRGVIKPALGLVKKMKVVIQNTIFVNLSTFQLIVGTSDY
jgi:hypothetical protein